MIAMSFEYFQVSIQLIAPASGATRAIMQTDIFHDGEVSIQLIAPASGATYTLLTRQRRKCSGFHSTDCPSEWGLSSPRGQPS